MTIFTKIQYRRNQLIRKGLNPSSLVLITNRRTMYHILHDAGVDKKLLKDSKNTQQFYGMKVIIIKSDNFQHNLDLHFEIYELINHD